jgi:hypothetical protein
VTDVLVHRVHNGEPLTDEGNTARLVFSDGCRNPAYRVLAPFNPWRDDGNALINNFDFRVFMFQAMQSGDAIMITAKVMACVEEVDCAPVWMTINFMTIRIIKLCVFPASYEQYSIYQ